jgi:NAD(P)-dependent dehydrogenase (short-subunit alcohol dehydrogenase family)
MSRNGTTVTMALLTGLTARAVQAQAAQQAVLVTGASTGIGRKITEVLAAKGYYVYAGARKEQDLKELDAIANVQSIEKAGRGLYGLVNSKGRVATIGSISGFLSGMLSGPYSMSKHAVEAFTDALAGEMARFGVKVSVIEPGNYQSEIGKTLVARMQARGKTIEGSMFETEMRGLIHSVSSRSNDPEPDDVAQAALHALFDPNPKLRYSHDSLVAILDQALARAK